MILEPKKIKSVSFHFFPIYLPWSDGNWCLQTMELEKTLENPLDCKTIKPVSPKGNQPWIFIGRTDAEAEVPVLATWCKKLIHWKRSRCWEKTLMLRAVGKGETEDGIVGWHQWLSGHEFEQTPGDSEGQGSWHAAVHGVSKSQTWCRDWRATTVSDHSRLYLDQQKVLCKIAQFLDSQQHTPSPHIKE